MTNGSRLTRQLRWLAAECLIAWALDVAPVGEGKKELAEFIHRWIPRQEFRG